MAFDDFIAAEEDRTKEGRAHLTHTAANAFDRAIAKNNQRLGVTVIEADISEDIRH